MALGDGTTWDETAPTDATSALQIDDYNRDLRAGTRSRMALEHEWPSSQSATSEAGKHKYVTLQEQTVKPTLSGTQIGGVYTKTDHKLYFENSAGSEVVIVSGTAVGDGKILASATDAAANYISAKVDTGYLTISGTNVTIATGMVDVYRYNSLSASTQVSARGLIMCYGTAAVNANSTASITNLPFAGATSYGITIAADTHKALSNACSVAKVDGTTATIRNNFGSNYNFNWIAIGE